MMEFGSDDYGHIDDEAFLAAATQVDVINTCDDDFVPSPRPHKRIKTATRTWVSSNAEDNASKHFERSAARIVRRETLSPYHRDQATSIRPLPAFLPLAHAARVQCVKGGKLTPPRTSRGPLTTRENGASISSVRPVERADSSNDSLTSRFTTEQELVNRRPSASASSSSLPEAEGENHDRNMGARKQAVAPRMPAAVGTGLRQTTLFGTTVQPMRAASQAPKTHHFPLVDRTEPPTHHELDYDALCTWIYPTNLGRIRDYQFNICHRALFHNLLVALPTGLGKTFIAATVMLNFYRWTKSGQIVFVAPTKPLVAQQINACYNIAGIPRSDTTLLTGQVKPALRAEEWESKRVFFMTPQTVVNDLARGYADPKRVVLLVIDEAHRATGGYDYTKIVQHLRRFNQSFRVLALTATPGSTIESVQQVIDSLSISRVEIRTEESLDIRSFIHKREITTVEFDLSEDMSMLLDLFSTALKPVLAQLNQQNMYWMKDPTQLSKFGLLDAQKRWIMSDAGRKAPGGLKGAVIGRFTAMIKFAHCIELLKYHGIAVVYHNLLNIADGMDDGSQRKNKFVAQVRDDENYRKMMERMKRMINDPEFVGHPKLEYLRSVVLNHFLDAGEGQDNASNTRAMVFVSFRDSAEWVVKVLNRHSPTLRAHVFVGQASSKGSEGMSQTKQQEIMDKFKNGTFNTLVATSIGEEGLDVGEVDIIVCYDGSASPIRTLQRMGRTGRKRKGNIVLLQVKPKEVNDWIKAQDNYSKMQEMIASGARFTFHDEQSRRIIPKDMTPAVDKRVVEIPVENSQTELPEPRRKRGKALKKPPKRFHMPDGVRTGFVKASRMSEDEDDTMRQPAKQESHNRSHEKPTLVPPLESVLLSAVQDEQLGRNWQYIHQNSDLTISVPSLKAQSLKQRTLRPYRFVGHGRASRRFVDLVNKMGTMDANPAELRRDHLVMSDLEGHGLDLVDEDAADGREDEANVEQVRKKGRATKPSAAPQSRGRILKTFQSPLTAMEAESSSPPQSSVRMVLPSQGEFLGSQDTSGEEEEEIFDSELADFVVDDAASVEMISSSLPPSSFKPSEPFYVPLKKVEGDDSSDDDLSLETGMISTRVAEPELATTPTGEVQLKRQGVRKRRIVEEDDSD